MKTEAKRVKGVSERERETGRGEEERFSNYIKCEYLNKEPGISAIVFP